MTQKVRLKKQAEDKKLAARTAAIKTKVSKLQLDSECRRILFQVQRNRTGPLYDEVLRTYAKCFEASGKKEDGAAAIEEEEEEEEV